MYLSLDWLKDLVNIPKSFSSEELGRKLTMHTVEIEGVEKQKEKFEKIIVGKVLGVNKHPNADKLFLTQVDTGKEKIQVVCGAPNISSGQFVPVALPGAILPNGMEIKESQVRGENSQGMICAEDELGLGEDHSGIMVLDKKTKPGQYLADYFKMEDILFEVDNKSITHRPDLWGHLGIAREIAAFLNISKTSLFSEIEQGKIKEPKQSPDLDIKIEDPDLCPRYMGLQISDIKIEESPEWLQKRLTAVGMRPINNLVDVTNYVMLELGQPLHAFDSNLVDSLVIRRAQKGEKIVTLDGEERKLEEGMLVIADQDKPIAIAGVMGGENSEISNNTTSIILESANFEPVQVRKTSQKLGLRTEASVRFEKSLDPHMAEQSLIRTWNLIKKVCPQAKLKSKISDVSSPEGKENNFNLTTGPIELNLTWLNQRIGEELGSEKIIDILEKLGFKVEKDKKNSRILMVDIPTWRATKDISLPEDLLEEVVRIYGFDNLNPQMPQVTMQAPLVNSERKTERKIKNILFRGCALTEVYNYAFTNQGKLEKLNINPSSYIALANPISNQHTLLRQNLANNLLENIKSNQARFSQIKLFEIGNVFLGLSGEINKDSQGEEKLPYQEKHLGLIAGTEKKIPFSQIKGYLEYLLQSFGLEVRYEESEEPMDWVQKETFARIKIGGRDIGFVFGVDNKVLTSLGIKKKVAGAEIVLKELIQALEEAGEKKYQPESKFPFLERDLAFVVEIKVLYNDIKDEIENFHKLIKKVELFDVYQGEK